MLKRQRPASPLPSVSFGDAGTDLIDISGTHGAKRRRVFAPVLDGALRGWGTMGAAAFEEEYPEEEEEVDELRSEGGNREGGLETRSGDREGAVEVYKSTNSLLHDLHTLQQFHRLASGSFSSSSPRASAQQHRPPSPPQHTYSKGVLPHISERPHQSSHSNPSISGLGDQKCITTGTSAGGMDPKVQRVKERYEDTNRYALYPFFFSHLISSFFSDGGVYDADGSARLLGSLFLSRRRELES